MTRPLSMDLRNRAMARLAEDESVRAVAARFGVAASSVVKWSQHHRETGSVAPARMGGHRQCILEPRRAFIIERIEQTPHLTLHGHAAKRIFERLRIEHGFLGGDTVVKDYVRIARARSREVFIPLAHPGDAQVDFGECVGVIGGVRMKLHVFCFDLPHSDAYFFIKAYPAETTEAFLDGCVSAFAFFGGIPISILHDNLKIAVAKILGDGKRKRPQAFIELVSHYLFRDRFGRPGKGNDKGNVEALVKYSRGISSRPRRMPPPSRR